MLKSGLATPARKPRLPSLDLLKGFEAAARHLSFTRAAEELFLTQSALSRQMQTLEEQLGMPLFERRQVAGAAPNAFLNARENAASES